MFKEEEGFALRKCDVSLLIQLLSILLMCVVGWIFPSKNQQKTRNMCKPLINSVCSVILEQSIEKEQTGFSWCTMAWTLNLASVKNVQAMGKLGVKESRIFLKKGHVMEETVLRKPGFVFVPHRW